MHWALFFGDLARMLEAGINISDCLGFMSENFDTNRRLATIAGNLEKSVHKGSSLSQACVAPEFTKFHIAMIQSGEESGRLAQTLHEIARYEDGQTQLRKSLLSAMAYPCALLLMALAFALALPYFFQEPVTEIFVSAGMELPQTLVVYFKVYELLGNPWVLGPLIVAIFLWGAGLRRLLAFEGLQASLWKFLLKFPVVGSITRTICEQRLANVLSFTRSAGLVSSMSLKLAADVMSNVIYRDACLQAARQVAQGTELPAALKETGVFSQSFLMVLASSEEVGKLPEMLEKYSGLLTQLIDENLKAAIPLIQPFLLAFMAIVVLIFAFNVLGPLNQLINAL